MRLIRLERWMVGREEDGKGEKGSFYERKSLTVEEKHSILIRKDLAAKAGFVYYLTEKGFAVEDTKEYILASSIVYGRFLILIRRLPAQRSFLPISDYDLAKLEAYDTLARKIMVIETTGQGSRYIDLDFIYAYCTCKEGLVQVKISLLPHFKTLLGESV